MKVSVFYFFLIFTLVTGFYFAWEWSMLPKGQSFIYPVDDVYIHLAIAKHFAENGIWSVNMTGFDSASSSILYTLLLSFLIKIFGNWVYYPLVLNVVFGYGTVYMVYKFFNDFYGKHELLWAFILLLPFTLLYVMVLINMEHTIHMLLMVLAIYILKKLTEQKFQGQYFIYFLLVLLFISIVRYESLYFTLSVAFFLFVLGKYWKGILVLYTGFIVILVFGIISIYHGGYFFPNSVMIKGSFPQGNNLIFGVWQLFLDGILLNPSFYKTLFFPFILFGIFLVKEFRKENYKDLIRENFPIFIVILMGILHALFTYLKYRYEDYLMISVFLVVVPVIVNLLKNKLYQGKVTNIAVLFCVGFIVAFSGYRFCTSDAPMKVGSLNILQHQIEMSKFLEKNYKGKVVSANDIGAISYYSGAYLVDIVGLGTTDVAKIYVKARKMPENVGQMYVNSELVRYMEEKRVKIVMIYPGWFPGEVPKKWILVAKWIITANEYSPSGEILIYTLNEKDAQYAKAALQKFQMNPNVTLKMNYP